MSSLFEACKLTCLIDIKGFKKTCACKLSLTNCIVFALQFQKLRDHIARKHPQVELQPAGVLQDEVIYNNGSGAKNF